MRIADLPAKEKESAAFLTRNLGALNKLVDQFEDAFRLYKHAFDLIEKRRPLHRWPSPPPNFSAPGAEETFERSMDAFIERSRSSRLEEITFSHWLGFAVQQSVILVHQVDHLVGKNSELLKHCPTVQSRVDKDLLKLTSKTFGSTFPDCHAMRGAVGHSEELGATPAQFAIHALKVGVSNGLFEIAPGSSTHAGGIRVEPDRCILMATRKGKLLSHELSTRTVAALRKAADTHILAFANTAAALG